MSIKQLPNCISIFRLILVAPIIWCLLAGYYQLTFFLFILAGVSDGLDGFLARRFHWTSQFGAFMDPLADKLLMVLTYLCLGYLGHLPVWLVAIVIGRDLIIVSGGIAYRILIEEPVYNPTFISKINTVLQLGLVVAVLFNQVYGVISSQIIDIFMYVVASTTVLSCLDYMYTWGRQAILVKRSMKYSTKQERI